MKTALRTTFSTLADFLTPVLGLAETGLALLVRLVRLARMRARVKGFVPADMQFDGPVAVVGHPKMSIGRACRLGRYVHLETHDGGEIQLGEYVRLSAGVHLVSCASITIGDHALIGEYTSIRDANHGIEPGVPYRLQNHSARPIQIGSNVWIGRGAAILSGVTIGEGAVIGANSVVTRDIPPYTVAVGCPASPIKSLKN